MLLIAPYWGDLVLRHICTVLIHTVLLKKIVVFGLLTYFTGIPANVVRKIPASIMKNIVALLILVTTSPLLFAQTTFKAGWNNYQASMIIREYIYSYTYTDSFKLFLTDSVITYVATDSMVTQSTYYRLHDKSIYKTINYLTGKKQVTKTEEYKDDNLQVMSEWKYDDKGRKTYSLEDNKLTGNVYKKNYDYSTDKKTNEAVVTESAYFNNKIEFYTKSYFDKNGVKIKEVRLNDNNKDVIHVESYIYGENGKVKERSVYFPEFKVTKKFTENDGLILPKCYSVLPMGVKDKINIHTRVSFMKKFLASKVAVIFDRDCDEFSYKFISGNYCDIIVASSKMNNVKKVTFRYREKV